ncbi:hypothetical protein HHL22_11810 [Hymenobacter sp. RP-2-7]|uniref:T9SS type A sorting domain-containing protein n=1 Tax=Hymenobacter polaris TaxID=2682546 RepID=A0A7Y0AEG2_9BACT|nr:hypothetical protein [Hymenobacter polaris]NML65891.1 hypothetical protein [Hymenobacter polaris]
MKTFLIVLLSVLWGSDALGQTLYTFNGGGTTGAWTDASTWTTDPTGSTSINARVPDATYNNVVITNSFTVSVTSAITTAGLNITIQRGGTLDLTSASATFAPLRSLGGQGTLRIGAPYFPRIPVNGNNFDDAGTGTVEFYNWSATTATLPIPKTGQYNNLRLLNTSATAYTAQLDSTLTLAGSLTLTRTNTTATAPLISMNLGKTASANRTLNILGNVTVGVGTALGVSAVTGAHVLNVSGSLVNNGTVRLHNTTTNAKGQQTDDQIALLNFTGATDANFACNGLTDLDILQVDKGIDSQVLLNVTATVATSTTAPSGNRGDGNLRLSHTGDGRLLALINGVTKLGGNINLSRIHRGSFAGAGAGTGYYELGSSATSPTLWIAGAQVNNNTALAFVVYGTYRISSGTFISVTSDAMVVREDGQMLIEGGTTTVDKFRPSSTSANHRGSFIMTGGVFEATGTYAGSGATTNFARFAIPYLTQSFRMSGGTLRVANPANCPGLLHIGINSSNAIVSGGSIEVQLPNTNTNGNILTTAPLWNLTILKPALTNSTTSKAMLADITSEYTSGATNTAQPLTVLNNFLVDGTNPTTFDANAQNVTIQGSLIINSGSTYLPSGNTTTFSGRQDQLLTNDGAIGASDNTFNNWVIDKPAGTLTLGGAATYYTVPAAGTLSLLNGVLNDGGATINVLGNMVNSASHTSGGGGGSITLAGSGGQVISGNNNGVFGNLKLFSTAADGTVAVTMTANMSVASVLTMGSNNLLAIGANRLALTNVLSGALALGPGNTYSKNCFIQTAGNQSDLGLQRTFGKGDSFLYPVGTGAGTTARYAPATIELRLASSAALTRFGQVSVSPVSSRNPFVASTTNSLAYYWKVRSVGFGTIPASSVYETFTMTNADAALPTNASLTSYVPGRYLPTAWTKYSGTINRGAAVSDIVISAIDDFPGEFTAGQASTFGPITAFYSRVASGNWEDKNTWSTAGFNGAAASGIPASNNPVFIGSASGQLYHTVTVTQANAKSGSLVIDRGSVMDVGTTTGHNFGALPDAKVGGSGRLRVSSSAATVTFPGGDFGSFLQQNGGTVEYYTTGTQDFTVPTASGTLTLNQYRNLWLNAGTSRTITLPSQDLRVYAQLKTGVANTLGGTTTTYPGLVLLSNGAAGNLRADSLLAVQAGTLRFANATARTLTLDTDLRVDAGATFDVATSGTAVANALTVGGSLTNNGTLDLKTGTTTLYTASLTFGGTQDANFTGTTTNALTDLSTLTLNKGLGQTATLNLDVAGTLTTPTSNWLGLVNGTLRYAKTTGTLTIHNAASPYAIPDAAALTVDAPGANVTVATGGGATTSTNTPANNTSSPSDLKLAGQLQVLQGTLSVGAVGNLGNDLEYASAGAPTIRVGTGGTLYVNGQVRRTTANTSGSLRYDQSGGTVSIDGARAEVYQNNERGLFEVQGPKSIFRMSGGTLALRGTNTRPTIIADLYLRPDSTVVTAGTVLLGKNATGNLTVSVESLVPLYDLKVETGPSSSGTNTGLLTGVNPLRLKGSLTIASNFSFFNANSLGLSIDQNLVNNNASTNTGLVGTGGGGFQPGTATQTTTFTGLGPVVQELMGPAGNLTVFGGLVVNNAQTGGTLQLDRNARVVGTLTIAKGTLADNGQTLTALGDVVNTATHSSTGSGSLTLAGTTNQNLDGNHRGRFGNVVLNNAAGATTLANQEITGVLTMTSGVLTIGSNLLWLSNPAAGAITGFSAARFIRTNGIVADLGLRKSYPAGTLNFTFPVGAAAKYTPVVLNVTGGSSAAGLVTVQPIDLAHPSTTGSGTNKISFYWKVSSTLNSPTVNQQFTYGDNDVKGDETTYKVGRFYKGAWTPLGGITASTNDAAANTLSNNGYTGTSGSIDGDYTGGETTEFGLVPTFYSRNSTAGQAGGANWDNAAAWTSNSDGSDPLPTFNSTPTLANPVVIRSGHLINANGSSRGAATLQLLGTLDLSTGVANNFNTVTGTGTVRIGSALFPAGNYSAFMLADGGTVDYSGAVQLPARDTYNNLTFSGGNAKQLSNLDLTINGALTVAANTTVNNLTNQSITLTSATSGATLGGTFNLGDGPLTTGAFLNNTGTLNLGAGLLNVGTSFANAGTVNLGTGNVVVGTAFGNSGTYNANKGTGNLSVSTTFDNSGTYNAGAGQLLVNGDLTNAASGTLTAAGGDITTQGNFTNSGVYAATDNLPNTLRVAGNFSNLSNATSQGKVNQPTALAASTSSFTAKATNMVLRGNFLNTGSFVPGTSVVQLLLDNNYSLTGPTTFFDLQKGGAGNLSLGNGTNVTVADLLTMRNGLIYTGTSNIVNLSNANVQPIVGASSTTYVAGRLAMALPNTANSIRTFPVGLGGRYRPITIVPQGTNSSSPVVLTEIFNSAPQGPLDGTMSNMSSNRYYRVQLQSGSIDNPTVQLSFNTDAVDEQVYVPGNLRVAKSSGTSGPWTTTGGSGVFSPEAPRGYVVSAPTSDASSVITSNSFFALASTNKVDNPLTPAPLPVELVQFTATRQASAVRVAWTTASEKNSAYFVVQRSPDGHTFAELTRVVALGSSANRHDYATLDAAPLPGLSYYRLQQVDRDGTFTYSAAVAVHFESQAVAASLVAYPNPVAATSQRFQLQALGLPTPGGTVQLFDNVGRLVLRQAAAPGTAEVTLEPRQPLAPGLYFATWQALDGQQLTTKVLVE